MVIFQLPGFYCRGSEDSGFDPFGWGLEGPLQEAFEIWEFLNIRGPHVVYVEHGYGTLYIEYMV